jgi:threonine dehydratase
MTGQLATAPTLHDVRLAAARIRTRVRHTPLIEAAPAREHPAIAAQLLLKLESLQVTGSFKARGASNALVTMAPAAMARGVVTASGGNHGLAVAYAAWSAGVPATIYLPSNVPGAKLRKLQAWGAKVVVEGEVWDDSNAAALHHAEQHGTAYIHPFADPLVIAGQGTVATEILDAVPGVDTLLVAIGGGGLISGIAVAAREIKPGVRIIGVEPTGAPTLLRSLEAGRPSVLERVDTAAGTLAPRSTDPLNFSLIQRHVERVVLVSDAAMRDAAAWLWFEHGVAAELSGAAAVAALLTGAYRPAPGERLCAVVCGAGSDGIAP